MPFKRNWDSTCPRVWTRWESDGIRWVTQDLPPEDDEEALQLLLEQLVPDEVLCICSDMGNDPASMAGMEKFWRVCLAQRVSIACYAEQGGKRTLAGLNCCIVQTEDAKEDLCEVEGERWKNVYGGLGYCGQKINVFKEFGEDTVYYGMGLVVRRDFRGAKLGAKILEARKPLCEHLGIRVSTTVFTGPASQKCAAKAGFTTLLEVSLRELRESGLKYPPEDRVIKFMAKQFW